MTNTPWGPKIPYRPEPWVDWCGFYSEPIYICNTSYKNWDYLITFSVICPWCEYVEDWFDAGEHIQFKLKYDKEKCCFTHMQVVQRRKKTKQFWLQRTNKTYNETYEQPKVKIPADILEAITSYICNQGVSMNWPHKDLKLPSVTYQRDLNISLILDGGN